MPEIKNTFLKGKMNKSLDDRLLPEGEYRDALNIQVSETENEDVGSVQNIKSNVLVHDMEFSNAKVLGSIFDDKNNRVFFFVKDDSNNYICTYIKREISETINNFITSYSFNFGFDVGPNEISVFNGEQLLENGVDFTFSKTSQKINFTLPIAVSTIKIVTIPSVIASGSFLNFSFDHLITGINIIEDLLFWTDNLNEPRRISIDTAIGDPSYYNSNDKVNVARYSPFKAPEITNMSNESTIDSNYIEDKFVRFSYRFKFKEKEYSQLAPFSNIAFVPKNSTLTTEQVKNAYKQAVLNDFVNGINQVNLNIPLPSDADAYDNYEIRSVEILIKDSNSQAVRVIAKKDISSGQTSISYIYKSEIPSYTLPEEQVVRVSENIPIKALAQEVAGNRIIYGNFTQNYNLPDIDFDVEISKKDNATLPAHSLKQRRKYEVGIVLSDKYGRKSPVILPSNGKNIVYASALEPSYDIDTESWNGNSLKINFNSVPGDEWHSYRVVVKQNEQEYYNVYTPGIGTYKDYSYITIFADNINKVPRDTTNIDTATELAPSNVRLYPKLINRSQYIKGQEDFDIDNGEIIGALYTISNNSSTATALAGYTSFLIQKFEGTDLVSNYLDLQEETVVSDAGGSYTSSAPNKVYVFVNGKFVNSSKYTYSDSASAYGRVSWTADTPVSTDKIDIIIAWNLIQVAPNTTGVEIPSLTTIYHFSGGSPNILKTRYLGEYTAELSVNAAEPYEDNYSISTNYPLLSDGGLLSISNIGTLDGFNSIDQGILPTNELAGFYNVKNKNYIAELPYSDDYLKIYNFDTSGLSGMAVDLAVFETYPFVSVLDIYYETSHSDLISNIDTEQTIEVDYYNTFIVKGPNPTVGQKRWHIEESRIRGDYNANSVDLGVIAHLVDNEYEQTTRQNTLIHSGIYNPITGVNNTNQFASGKNITKSLDIQNGSIQKLFSEDTNLTVLQEEKSSWIAIDKDIIYTAEGSPQVTTTDLVFGQVVSYNGNYGIGTNPESFAYYAGRKYFVDKPKGAVLRLSRDGITEISNYGMKSFFRNNLKNYDTVIGAWDIYNSQYIVSMQSDTSYKTLGFKEGINGWVSFYSYDPESAGYLDSVFYTFKEGNLWEHYAGTTYNSFYGQGANSKISLILNQNPSANKNFLTINYEGSDSWNIYNIETDTDSAFSINKYDSSIIDDENSINIANFNKHDGKYVSDIINNSSQKENEVVFGRDMSGIKGFFMKVDFSLDSSEYKELFSVSTNYNINSY